MKHPSISEYLVSYLLDNGVKRIFGIPGSYVIDLVDNISKKDGLTHVSAFHESGAGFMAQGYSQVTGRFGVLCTTEGPGALNAVNALASAKADGDSILFIQGVIPENKLNIGALQDTLSFDLDLGECLKGLSVFQGRIQKSADFADIFEKAHGFLSKKDKISGPVHLQISIDSFPASLSKSVFLPQLEESERVIDSQFETVIAALNHAKNPLLLIEKVFGRLARGSKITSNRLLDCEQKRIDIQVTLKSFINSLINHYKSNEFSNLSSTTQVMELKKKNPNHVDRAEEFIGDEVAVLSSQRVVTEISDCIQQGINFYGTKISQLNAINYVADTGSSKLLIAHYCDFSKGLNKEMQFRCFMPGSYDTMGYAIGCALGVSLGSKDMAEDALTIALVGECPWSRV